MNCTPENLKEFEKGVVDMFNAGMLKSPVHLSGSIDDGLENFLIGVFKQIKSNDWLFTTYRSHYHALLKGLDPEWLKTWILNNKSIHLMNKEHKIFTSAIVGGTLSIALGVALAIKIKSQLGEVASHEPHNLESGKFDSSSCDHVWLFCGDTTAETGVFHEVSKYARRQDLPITFVIEDNGLSTDTPTQSTWGNYDRSDNILRFKYKRLYGHYGTGVFVKKLWEDMAKDDIRTKGF